MLSVGFLALAIALQRPASPAPQQGGAAPTRGVVAADTGAMRHANGRTPRLAFATRLPDRSDAIDVDGKLDEPIWARASAMTNFSQTAPSEGSPATERTE